MKVYQIDPFTKEIRAVEHDGSLESIRNLTKCDVVTVVRISHEGDFIYVDDEGLLKPFDTQQFFKLSTYAQPLAGFGLVVGSDEDGNDVPPSIGIEALRSMISFPSHAEVIGKF